MVALVSSQFLKCPDSSCNCLFLNPADLQKHLAKFGIVHSKTLKQIHQDLENQYASSEWDEADKWQANTERRLKEAFKIYKGQQ